MPGPEGAYNPDDVWEKDFDARAAKELEDNKTNANSYVKFYLHHYAGLDPEEKAKFIQGLQEALESKAPETTSERYKAIEEFLTLARLESSELDSKEEEIRTRGLIANIRAKLFGEKTDN